MCPDPLWSFLKRCQLVLSELLLTSDQRLTSSSPRFIHRKQSFAVSFGDNLVLMCLKRSYSFLNSSMVTADCSSLKKHTEIGPKIMTFLMIFKLVFNRL